MVESVWISNKSIQNPANYNEKITHKNSAGDVQKSELIKIN